LKIIKESGKRRRREIESQIPSGPKAWTSISTKTATERSEK
jgi:hypothetical protein